MGSVIALANDKTEEAAAHAADAIDNFKDYNEEQAELEDRLKYLKDYKLHWQNEVFRKTSLAPDEESCK